MRMLGIEPRAQAWGACMLPLHYMRARNLKRAGFVPRAPAWTRSLWQTEGWIRKKKRSPSDDTLAEWLRRRPAKPMGSPCVGSNPTGVAFAADNIRRQTKQGQRRWRDPCDAVDKGGCAADTKNRSAADAARKIPSTASSSTATAREQLLDRSRVRDHVTQASTERADAKKLTAP